MRLKPFTLSAVSVGCPRFHHHCWTHELAAADNAVETMHKYLKCACAANGFSSAVLSHPSWKLSLQLNGSVLPYIKLSSYGYSR